MQNNILQYLLVWQIVFAMFVSNEAFCVDYSEQGTDEGVKPSLNVTTIFEKRKVNYW